MEQQILTLNGEYSALAAFLSAQGWRKVLLVCDSAYRFLKISTFLDNLTSPAFVRFDRFQPNPRYESVVEGVSVLRENGCDAILAIGGGSAIDVAKCIKLYAYLDPAQNYLRQPVVPNDLPLTAMPTTAGTGSEATRFAVIYYEGEKQSVADPSIIPSTVLFDASALKTLPEYQKKSTMLDALCHAVESSWSVHATEESRAYAAQAIRAVLGAKDAYLANTDAGNAAMLRAANLAGKAINITQTTAGHAMCYKLTSLYGAAHGHAAALCVRRLWPWMLAHTDRCIDPRGEAYLQSVFAELAGLFGADTPEAGAARFNQLFDELALPVPTLRESDLPVLSGSVNPVRLKNNPVSLEGEIPALYRAILR